jgi:2'-5' RNA ligase
MKLHEIYFNKDMPVGTYVGVRFDDETKQKIQSLMDEIKLNSRVPLDKLHSTVLYSDGKTLSDFKSSGDIQQSAKPKQFSLFKNSENPETNCLVVELESDYLNDRFNSLTKEYEITPKFPDYKPHITLSYDYQGDLPDNSLLDKLGIVNISSEYDEPINRDFAKNL